MTSSSAARGVISVLFNRHQVCFGSMCAREFCPALGSDVNVVSYLPAALACGIYNPPNCDWTLWCVERFLLQTPPVDMFTVITGDRWGLVSGLIRVLTLESASHVCDNLRRGDDSATDDVNDEDNAHESADGNGYDDTDICSHDDAGVRCNDSEGEGDDKLRNGDDEDDGMEENPIYDVDYIDFSVLCVMHRTIVKYVDVSLKHGASYSDLASVLQCYDSELGQAVTTPCGCRPTFGEQIHKIHVRVRKIIERTRKTEATYRTIVLRNRTIHVRMN